MQKSIEAVGIIEECLNEYVAGWKNTEALSAIAKPIRVIEQESGDCGDVRVLLVSLRGYIDILYSTRKHEGYDVVDVDGVDVVKGHILADCSSLRRQLRGLQKTATK
jgi:hypothetical protein